MIGGTGNDASNNVGVGKFRDAVVLNHQAGLDALQRDMRSPLGLGGSLSGRGLVEMAAALSALQPTDERRLVGALDAENNRAAWWAASRGETVQGEVADRLGALAGTAARNDGHERLPQGVRGTSVDRSPGLSALVCAREWSCADVRRIISCESSGDPLAVSADGRNWGLLQINLVHLDKLELLTGSRDPYLLLDSEINVAVGYAVYVESGWFPWACRP